MLRNAFEFLEDLTGYARTFATRAALRRKGHGEDFSSDEYKESSWRAVAGLHPVEMKLRVVSIRDETPSSRTLRCERVDGEIPPFRAGQYVNVFVKIDGIQTSRPYSISSAPGRQHLDLTIKVAPGGFVAPHLGRNVNVGDELITTGIAGSFTYEPLFHGDDLVFIAAGSGITPFMSMLRSMTRMANPPRVSLIYGSRHEDEIIYRDELAELVAMNDWLSLTLVLSRPSSSWFGEIGRIEASLLERTLDHVSGRMFYICGPEGLYTNSEAALLELGVERHRILREQFGAPADITSDPAWPEAVSARDEFHVEVEGLGSIKALAGESLLTSLERNNMTLPTVCRTGSCSSCRVKVVTGSTFTLSDAGIREADRCDGFTHACVTYPVGDMTVRP